MTEPTPSRPEISRRDLLKTSLSAGAVLAVPTIIPASALGRDGATAPSERIALGTVGTGGMGRADTKAFLNQKDVQVVAVCDVDAGHRKLGKQLVDEHYDNEDCRAFRDFRDLVARDDIDAVCVTTPDHWHALVSIAAAKAGKDVYCEKPLANSVGEGRAICDAVEENNRVLQTGSHERSNPSVRRACELVRAGRIGQLREIRVHMPTEQDHHQRVRNYREKPEPQPVPEGFDYEMWLGHTAKVPFIADRVHFWWRFVLAYGGGEMTDRGAHIIDIGQLGADRDDTGPVRYRATGAQPLEGIYDAFMEYTFVNEYEDGLRLVGDVSGPRGLRFVGDEGSLFVHVHGGHLEADPAGILDIADEDIGLDLGRTESHHRNFLDCVRSRERPFADHEIGHRTATICHLNNIAMLLGRSLQWDPKAEKVIDDDEANAMLTPKMREPWTL